MREAYDIVVIGGGHNGLVAALDLLRAGLSVCVLEARDQFGGCAITTEPLLPHFRHSPHANCFVFADLFPDRISPSRLSVGVIQPEAQLGVAFSDGRPPVILHRPDLLDDTRRSLGAYSPRDAAKYVELKRRSERLGPLLQRSLYSAPEAGWFDRQRESVRRVFRSYCGGSKLGRRTARELIEGIFETPEIRILLYALAIETGVGLEDPGGDIAFLAVSLWVAGRWRIPVGGMQNYSAALAAAARDDGAELFSSTTVARVLVEQGRAVGVEIAGGGRVIAKQAVVSATPLLTLFDAMLNERDIAPSEQVDVNIFRQTSAPSIGTSAFCLDQAPRYRSGRHDDQINRCLKTVIGRESPADFLREGAEIHAGLLPSPAGIVRMHSLWDSTLAPAGRHIAAIDSVFPPLATMNAETWRAVASSFPVALSEVWQRHLVGVHCELARTMSFDDGLDFERRMLVRSGQHQYRTSIRGLYLAGPGVYPGGGVHGACGRNAATTILAALAMVRVINRS